MWKPSVGYTAIGGIKSVRAASRMLGESGSSISQRPYQSNLMERSSFKRVGLIMTGFGNTAKSKCAPFVAVSLDLRAFAPSFADSD